MRISSSSSLPFPSLLSFARLRSLRQVSKRSTDEQSWTAQRVRHVISIRRYTQATQAQALAHLGAGEKAKDVGVAQRLEALYRILPCRYFFGFDVLLVEHKDGDCLARLGAGSELKHPGVQGEGMAMRVVESWVAQHRERKGERGRKRANETLRVQAGSSAELQRHICDTKQYGRSRGRSKRRERRKTQREGMTDNEEKRD